MRASTTSLAKLHYPLVTRIPPLAYHCLSVSRQSPSFRNCVFYPSSRFKFNHRFGAFTTPWYSEPWGRRPVFTHSGKVKVFKPESGDAVSPRTTFLCVKTARPPIRKSYLKVYQRRLGNLSIASVGSVLAGAFLFCTFDLHSEVALVRSSADSAKLGIQNKDLISSGEIDWSTMTGEILPGRPGNLTSEQEEKLREIWIATLQVFGVLNSHHAREVGSSGPATPSTGSHQGSDHMTLEKPKKKRISLFGRKHKDNDNESMASTDPTSPVLPTDFEDKYGQTKQFHETLAHQTPESLRAAFWSMVKYDHPDALLLRFLRARKWDVEKALIMMVSTMNWRATEMHVDDDIMRLGEEGSLLAAQSSNQATKKSGEDFLMQMRMGKSYLHGVDKSGRPMCFVRVRLHKQGEQTEEGVERYTVFVIESARMLLAPPVDTAVSRQYFEISS
jgi:CRAL/TRIO, N-terminal domain/CRAL/TRIO domain